MAEIDFTPSKNFFESSTDNLDLWNFHPKKDCVFIKATPLSRYKKHINVSKKNLTTLVGFDWGCDPAWIVELDCSNNQLTDLEGCPPNVSVLHCWNNNLTTLKGCPESVVYLNCCYNKLTTLEYCPSKVSDLYCGSNMITTLKDLPKDIISVNIYNNKITTLKGCPKGIRFLYGYESNPLELFYESDPLDLLNQFGQPIKSRKPHEHMKLEEILKEIQECND